MGIRGGEVEGGVGAGSALGVDGGGEGDIRNVDVVEGGRIRFEEGCIRLPQAPGLGVTLDRSALAKLHENYLRCPYRTRDDGIEIRKYWPDWTPGRPRF